MSKAYDRVEWNFLKNVIFLTKYAELSGLFKKARIYATKPHIRGSIRKHQKGYEVNQQYYYKPRNSAVFRVL